MKNRFTFCTWTKSSSSSSSSARPAAIPLPVATRPRAAASAAANLSTLKTIESSVELRERSASMRSLTSATLAPPLRCFPPSAPLLPSVVRFISFTMRSKRPPSETDIDSGSQS